MMSETHGVADIEVDGAQMPICHTDLYESLCTAMHLISSSQGVQGDPNGHPSTAGLLPTVAARHCVDDGAVIYDAQLPVQVSAEVYCSFSRSLPVPVS